MEREDPLHHVRRLGRVVDGQVAGGRVEIRDQAARLQRHPGMAAEMVGLLDHGVGLGVGRIDIAGGVLALPGEVVAELGMDDRRVRIERGLHVGRRGQRLPFDLDQLGRVLGLLAALGDDGHHRLALPARHLHGERVLGRRFQPFEMGENADPGIVDAGKVGSRDHRHHAGRGGGGRAIDGNDPGMRVRAAHEGGMHHARQHDVVDEGAAPVRQAPCVGPRHAAADYTSSGGRESSELRSWSGRRRIEVEHALDRIEHLLAVRVLDLAGDRIGHRHVVPVVAEPGDHGELHRVDVADIVEPAIDPRAGRRRCPTCRAAPGARSARRRSTRSPPAAP